MLAFFAMVLLLSMAMLNRVVALMPYWSVISFLQSSTVTSRRSIIQKLASKQPDMNINYF